MHFLLHGKNFMKNNTINVTINGERLTCSAGATLAEIIKGEKPCGGHGKCGKCKVIAKGNISEPCETELSLLSKDELARGIRLGCLTYARGDCEIKTISESKNAQIVISGSKLDFELHPTFADYGVAIDIGTTTLAARLYDTRGNMLSETSCLNSQSTWGADVISRIEAAIDGKASALATDIRTDINNLISELALLGNIDSKRIQNVVITGNTVMLSLLTCQDTEPFSHAPFRVERLFGETIEAAELGLSALNPAIEVYLPPCISAFVGADTVCALLSSELCDSEEPRMLVDIGTNGEMALWKDGNLSVCSTAAGPAFEGVGISAGMRGENGAIDKVAILNGALCPHVIGEIKARGICGSGIVDAAACMLELELMDETGFIEDEAVRLAEGVELTQQDIRALQLAKSAIYAGICTLAAKSNCELTSISRLIVAGGFGNYLNMISAARIGLLPSEMLGKISVVGNAALAGASMLLLDRKLFKKASEIARSATVAELASDPIFSELYMNSMLF